MMDWNQFFMGMAGYVATKSKDPSSQFGAVIVDERNRVVSLGYNGFPIGTLDTAELYEDRGEKYRRILHAEMNAILFSQRQGHTLYVLDIPCSQCMAAIIQSGIKRVVHGRTNIGFRVRWQQSINSSLRMAKEAGVEVVEYLPPVIDH